MPEIALISSVTLKILTLPRLQPAPQLPMQGVTSVKGGMFCYHLPSRLSCGQWSNTPLLEGGEADFLTVSRRPRRKLAGGSLDPGRSVLRKDRVAPPAA
eukprot:scaffold232595_cov33-Tisochrysis_lutea.AAC.2